MQVEKGIQATPLRVALKDYIQIAKPGIIFGNLVAMLGGFLLASKGAINLTLLLYTTLGMILMVASGCVFNNYIDRDIDQKMKRTRSRAMPRGILVKGSVLLYATSLGILGVFILYTQTTTWATLSAIFGWFVYVILYTLYFKRNSIFGTFVGSFSGAQPPLIGYLAVSNQVDLAAVLLFITFVFWQMPHFYALVILRAKDYAAAKIPALPIVKGFHRAKIQMLCHIGAFIISTLLFSLFQIKGMFYFFVMLSVGVYWFYLTFKGLATSDERAWAKRNFAYSIMTITIFSVAIAIDTF